MSNSSEAAEGRHDRAGSRDEELTVDLGSLVQVAEMAASYVALAATGGVIGNAAYALLQGFLRRHGWRRRQEMEQELFAALKRVKRKPGVSDADLRLRAQELLRKLDEQV